MAQELKRKLTAILSADVKGYSRLMGEDEEWTVRTLDTFKGVMKNIIPQHRGRVVDSTGDNLLAEFASVVDAVQAAVEIQQVLRAKNSLLPENRRMEFRIGINLGDVIEEGERIFGDGVNIAARLEGLAEAGGICISGSAFEQIENKLPLHYDYLGEHEVKNITRPVRVYRALMDNGVVKEKVAMPKVHRTGRRVAVLSLVAALVIIAGVALWQFVFYPAPPSHPPVEKADPQKMAYALPDKPSIAVLPFSNLSADPGQDFLADGITENIITTLSLHPSLFVIARNSTFAYKGKSVKVQQVAEELGVRYVLEGSIVRSADHIRVTAQLIDALNGHHLWAERYDREVKDLFVLQDDLSRKILKGMELRLTRGEESLHFDYPKSLEVYFKIIHGREYLREFNLDSNNRARLIAEECTALEPNYWGSYALLGGVHMMDYWFGSTKDPAKSLQIAIEYLEKAAALADNSKGLALSTLGNLYAIKKDYDRAIELGERAIAMLPNGADAYAWLAMSLNFAGREQEALPLFEKAIRLNPLPPAFYYLNYGHTYRGLERYEEAVTMYKKAVTLTPNNIFAHVNLACTYALIGKEEEAKAAASEVLRINPKWSIENYEKSFQTKNKERLVGALRKAGLK